MARSRHRGSKPSRPPNGQPRSPRPSRDYIAASKAHLSRRRSTAYTQVDTVGIYLRRMARKQAEAEAKGEQFSAQRARGHKPREHVERREKETIREILAEIEASGRTEIKLGNKTIAPADAEATREFWDSISSDQKLSVLKARREAINNSRRKHRKSMEWQAIKKMFSIEDDKFMLVFAYHV